MYNFQKHLKNPYLFVALAALLCAGANLLIAGLVWTSPIIPLAIKYLLNLLGVAAALFILYSAWHDYKTRRFGDEPDFQ